MNIFALATDPVLAAQMHCDKHVVKMIVEYAQLLSTAHRVLDGEQSTHQGPNTKARAFNLLPGESVVEREIIREFVDEEAHEVITMHNHKLVIENQVCYNATHANHPSNVWARENGSNYWWLLRLLQACLEEYTFRYGKKHATEQLMPFLKLAPKRIPSGDQTPFPQAMPPQYQVPNDSVVAYHRFYLGSKIRFTKWTTRAVPDWFASALPAKGLHAADFHRTR
jgi:hypothetical protein